MPRENWILFFSPVVDECRECKDRKWISRGEVEMMAPSPNLFPYPCPTFNYNIRFASKRAELEGSGREGGKTLQGN